LLVPFFSLHQQYGFQAFLEVLGTNGLMLDGCKVYPPNTCPLSDGTEIVIHGKRFKFTYPPKQVPLSSFPFPGTPTRQTLRMSMIQSAEVFTPRPSDDPRVNLKILQSPLKMSPVKKGPLWRKEEEEEEIRLVHGNHPRVVEEEKDLVILEDVPVPVPSHTPVRGPSPADRPFTPPSARYARPATQRPRGDASLHRAVLIRSAQRAILQMEIEKEEVQEEEEVGKFVGEVSDSTTEDEVSAGEISAEEDEREEEEEEKEEGAVPEPEDEKTPAAKSRWRKSLEAVTSVWPFKSTPVTGEEEEKDITEVR
jgi:hypothetical protein